MEGCRDVDHAVNCFHEQTGVQRSVTLEPVRRMPGRRNAMLLMSGAARTSMSLQRDS